MGYSGLRQSSIASLTAGGLKSWVCFDLLCKAFGHVRPSSTYSSIARFWTTHLQTAFLRVLGSFLYLLLIDAPLLLSKGGRFDRRFVHGRDLVKADPGRMVMIARCDRDL